MHDPSEPQIMCSQTRLKMSPSYLLLVPQLSLTSPFLRLLRWWNVCTRPMQHLCQHLLQSKGLIFFNYFIAAELSWNSGEDLHIHTLPLSRGEEEEVTAEGSLTPVSGYELLLVKLHWYKHPLSWYIFLFYIFSFQSDSTKSHSNYHFSTFLKSVF